MLQMQMPNELTCPNPPNILNAPKNLQHPNLKINPRHSSLIPTHSPIIQNPRIKSPIPTSSPASASAVKLPTIIIQIIFKIKLLISINKNKYIRKW